MVSPLDEEYTTEPGCSFCAGSLPPQEREVRDHILLAVMLRAHVGTLEFWWSQLFGETKDYKASREQQAKLHNLCGQSKEHRAAFLRLANSTGITPSLRVELKNIVARSDNANYSAVSA